MSVTEEAFFWPRYRFTLTKYQLNTTSPEQPRTNILQGKSIDCDQNCLLRSQQTPPSRKLDYVKVFSGASTLIKWQRASLRPTGDITIPTR